MHERERDRDRGREGERVCACVGVSKSLGEIDLCQTEGGICSHWEIENRKGKQW